MRNSQDTKNLLILNQLVRNHFSLAPKSEKLFRYRTLYDLNKAPEYMDIIGNAPDLRKRFKIAETDLQYIDEGWSLFKNIFHNYVNHTNIEYKNFVKGKILIQKNEVKLFKAIYSYYKEYQGALYNLLNQSAYDNHMSDLIENLIRNFLNKKFGLSIRSNIYFSFINGDAQTLDLVIEYISKEADSVKSTKSYRGNSYDNSLQFPANEVFIKEDFENLIKTALTKTFERIGCISLPKKNLELVISCNPADMFMASTGENWTSCINMDSDFEELYWSGVPGAIIDKNRAIIYVTDGKKKEYQGIKVDKFIVRSWLLTMRDKDSNKNYIQIVSEYPIQINLAGILENLIDDYVFINYENDTRPNSVGRYYFEGIFFKTSIEAMEALSYIYLDSTGIRLSRNNKGKLFPNTYFYHKKGNRGHYNYGVNVRTGKFESNLEYFYSEDNKLNTLTFLIENDKELEIILHDRYVPQEEIQSHMINYLAESLIAANYYIDNSTSCSTVWNNEVYNLSPSEEFTVSGNTEEAV